MSSVYLTPGSILVYVPFSHIHDRKTQVGNNEIFTVFVQFHWRQRVMANLPGAPSNLLIVEGSVDNNSSNSR